MSDKETPQQTRRALMRLPEVSRVYAAWLLRHDLDMRADCPNDDLEELADDAERASTALMAELGELQAEVARLRNCIDRALLELSWAEKAATIQPHERHNKMQMLIQFDKVLRRIASARAALETGK